MAKKKALTPIEISFLEQIDACNRVLTMRFTLIDLACTCDFNREVATYERTIEIIRNLSRRGYLFFRDRKYPTLSSEGLKHVKRDTVMHFYDRHDNKTNYKKEPCTDEKPCSECVSRRLIA
jgi:hypothetical protein